MKKKLISFWGNGTAAELIGTVIGWLIASTWMAVAIALALCRRIETATFVALNIIAIIGYVGGAIGGEVWVDELMRLENQKKDKDS